MTNVLPRRRLLIAAIVLFALALGLTLFRLSRLSGFAGFNVQADWAMVDFRGSVYYPTVDFLNGGNPYDHDAFRARYPAEDAFPLYPPAILLLHAPFGLMGYSNAAVTFYLWTVALTLVTALAALRMNGFQRSGALVVMVASLMILSRPGHMNLLVGQDTLVYVLGTYLALHCAETAPVWSGLGLSLAFLKPSFGIPLILLFLARKRFWALFSAVGIGAVMNLPPLLILIRRAGGPMSFLQVMTDNFVSWREDPTVDPTKSLIEVSASGVLGRLLNHPLGPVGEAILLIVILGAAVAAVRVLDRQKDRRARALADGVVCLATLTGFHHQPYDLLLLTLPVVAFVGRRYPAVLLTRRIAWSLAVPLAVLGFNYIATHSGVAALQLTGLAYRLVTSINGVALMVIFALVVTTVLISPRASRASVRCD